MKKLFMLLVLLALAAPALSRDWYVPLDPDAPFRSKYNVFERAGVAAGDSFALAVSVRGWILKTDARGKVSWQIKSPCTPTAAPGFDAQMAAYACENGEMVALDLENGKQLWKFAFNDSVASAPAFHEEVLIFQTGDGRVIALNRQDGKIKWLARQASRHNLSLRAAGRPLVIENVVYVGMADGNFAALKLDNGDLVWKRRFFDQPITADLDFPLLADDKAVYASSIEGLCAISRASGKNYWCLDEQLALGPAQDENSIYALNTANEVLVVDKLAGVVNKRIRVKESALAKAERERPLALFKNDQGLIALFSTKMVRLKQPDYSAKRAKTFLVPVERADLSGKTLYLLNSQGYLTITNF